MWSAGRACRREAGLAEGASAEMESIQTLLHKERALGLMSTLLLDLHSIVLTDLMGGKTFSSDPKNPVLRALPWS